MLSLESPGSSSYLTTGGNHVGGSSYRMAGIEVDGVAASVEEDGSWSVVSDFSEGLHVIEVIGTDDEGHTHRDIRSVLTGEFQAPSGAVDDAVLVHVGVDSINAITPLINTVLEPALIEPLLFDMNPVMDDDYIVDAAGIDFGFVDVAVQAAPDVLQVEIVVHDLRIDLDIDGAPLGVDEGEIEAEQLVVHADVALGTDGSGGLSVQLSNPVVSFVAFEFGVNNFLANWFISDSDIEEQLVGELDGLLAGIDPMLEEALGGLDLAMEFELMEQPLSIRPGFGSAGVDADGVYLGLDLELDAVGASALGDGHLVVGEAPRAAGTGVTAQLADDFMNRFLHELWAAGVLNIELPIASDDLAALLLTALGAPQGVGGGLTLNPALPPVWIADGDATRLQLGAVAMVVDTPGGEFGDQVELEMALDASATIQLDAEAVGIVLGGPTIKMVPRGASAEIPELVAKMGEIEGLMGASMGAINEMLSFPLDELLDGAGLDIELPPIDIERDPSGRSTNIGLGADVLEGFVPFELTHMVYTVPVDAYIYDGNEDVELPGDTHLVCDGRIDVTADGTWYVGSEGRLRLYEGNHIVYAEAGARVEIETLGTVELYTDPDAEIDDPDGLAVTQMPRTLSLDDTAVGGCPE